MTIQERIRDKKRKIQYNINREAAKILVLLSGKFEKYEYVTIKQILPLNRRQATDKLSVFSFRKSFGKTG